METIATIVWHIFVVLCSIGVALVPIAVIAHKCEQIYRYWLWREADRGAMEAGKWIAQQAYWFSEDKSAMNALIAAGEAFRDCGATPDSNNVRERWYALNRGEK